VSRAARDVRDERLYFYDSIADDFDRIANSYDLARRIEVVFDELLGGELLHGRRLLDVGSGTGWFSKRAVERGAVATSVDIGIRLLARVREKAATRAVNADACALPFAPGSFDVVISSECIEHTLDPIAATREMARVLAPGGTLVITTPNLVWRWSASVANLLNLRPYDGYEHWISRRSMCRTLRGEGLRIDRLVGFHIVPPMVRATWPLLRSIDRSGQLLSPLMLNFGVRASRA
jgi:SAM-dependent methyltransferase